MYIYTKVNQGRARETELSFFSGQSCRDPVREKIISVVKREYSRSLASVLSPFLIRNFDVDEIVPADDLCRFIMMSLTELLNSLTSFLKHVARHGDYQPHVRGIIEALRN